MNIPFGGDSVLIPDLAEPILAWRWWRDSRRACGYFPITRAALPQGRLASWSIRDWLREGVTAECRADPFTETTPCLYPPSPTGDGHTGFGCGIYGYKSLQEALAGPMDFYTILGQVWLGGTIYMHEHGYRASEAKVAAICQTTGDSKALAEYYGVELLTLAPRLMKVSFDPDGRVP